MKKKLQIFTLSMLSVALFVFVVPVAFMRFPIAMDTLTFFAAFALLADRMGRE